jgi:hypothetical protein
MCMSKLQLGSDCSRFVFTKLRSVDSEFASYSLLSFVFSVGPSTLNNNSWNIIPENIIKIWRHLCFLILRSGNSKGRFTRILCVSADICFCSIQGRRRKQRPCHLSFYRTTAVRRRRKQRVSFRNKFMFTAAFILILYYSGELCKYNDIMTATN